MARMTARGRFAPTPSGPMHLGNARTALLAWLSCRAQGGAFVLRMEDLDKPRERPGAAAAILEELRWLGLDWDEGPDVGGPHAPYLQSLRSTRYQAVADALVSRGLAFPCCCSRAEVARASQAPHAGEDGPRYPGTCRTPDPARFAAARAQGRPPAIRLRVEPGEISFEDRLLGRCSHDVSAEVGDFPIVRGDGVASYQLAVTVDDVAMGITEVVRGADLVPSTPRQLLLYAALAATPPAFLHVPLVVGADGARLAKRHGARALGELRAAGEDPERIVAALAASAGIPCSEGRLSPTALVSRFSPALLSKHPAPLPPMFG